MYQYLNYNTFLSELFMFTKPVVLVEGLNDENLINTLFNHENIQSKKTLVVSPEIQGLTNKKRIVIKTISDIYNQWNYEKMKRFIGIVDCDFNEICKNKKNIPNLFYTDFHDIDLQVFLSDAFIKFIRFSYFNPENIPIENVRKTCIDLAKEFGYYLLVLYELSFHNHKEYLIPIEEYFNYSMRFLHDKVIRKLESLKLKGIFTESQINEINNLVKKKMSERCDHYHLANGHDVIRVLMMLTLWELFNLKKKGMNLNENKKILNNQKQKLFFVKSMENNLRMSYDFDFFIDSKLYKSIRHYEKKVNEVFING